MRFRTRRTRSQPGSETPDPPIEGVPGAVEPEPEVMTRQVLRRRVSTGAFFAGSWGLVNLFVGFFGNVALARMLEPRDFGIIAIGATLTMFATALSDGGIASGLIRREQPPTRSELRTAFGLQLSLTVVLATAAALIAQMFGSAGAVVAVMMIALPIAALQAPGKVVLTREVRVKELATFESIGVLVYYSWAVGGVVAGWGIWALATGVIMRAIVSSAGVMSISRLGLLTPTLRGTRALKPVIMFGVQFQGVSLAGIAREQGLNAGVAIIGGVSTLGLFSLARRLLELPVLMFEPLHRVSFPFMTHILAAKEDASSLINRGIAISAAAGGLLLAGTAAASPELVPGLFGEQWREAGLIVPWICAGIAVASPISVVSVGFLYALGKPSVVLRAIGCHTVALYAVAFPLLPIVGPAAIGMGSFAGALVDALYMSWALRREPESRAARPLRTLAPPLLIAAGAALSGIAISDAIGSGLVSAVAGGVSAGAIYLVGLAIFQLPVLRETGRLLAQAVRNSVGRKRGLKPVADPA
jgi:O-antigen/teichoic acid export membrane protein